MSGHILCLGIILMSAGEAWATSVDKALDCYPVLPATYGTPSIVRGNDQLTHDHADDLLWTINRNRMDAAGHFILAEIGCGAGCIRLASVDALTGDVRWLPRTISSWPIRMLQPIRYRKDSRLVIVFGQLDERGSVGPFRYLLTADGFHAVPEDQLCRTR